MRWLALLQGFTLMLLLALANRALNIAMQKIGHEVFPDRFFVKLR